MEECLDGRTTLVSDRTTIISSPHDHSGEYNSVLTKYSHTTVSERSHNDSLTWDSRYADSVHAQYSLVLTQNSQERARYSLWTHTSESNQVPTQLVLLRMMNISLAENKEGCFRQLGGVGVGDSDPGSALGCEWVKLVCVETGE